MWERADLAMNSETGTMCSAEEGKKGMSSNKNGLDKSRILALQ